MQKYNITKNKLFLALSIFLAATGLKAESFSETETSNNTDAMQLSTLINNMSNEEQTEFVNLVSEIKKVYNGNKKVSIRAKVKNLKVLIKKISCARLSGVLFRLLLAYICWDHVQPSIKTAFPETGKESATEFPKIVAGALVVDGIKDFLKEIREISEECFSIVYASLFTVYETATE